MRKNEGRKRSIIRQKLPSKDQSTQGPPQSNSVKTKVVRRIFVGFVRCFAPYGRTASLVSALVSGILLLLPKISIVPSVNLDRNDAFATAFAIKNEGHVPLFGIEISCSVDADGPVTLRDVTISGFSRPVNLWPGRTMTRSCPVKMPGMPASNVKVKVTAYYLYSYIIPVWRTDYFSGRHGSAGFALVPDIE